MAFREHLHADADRQPFEPDQDQAEEKGDEQDAGDRCQGESLRAQRDAREQDDGLGPEIDRRAEGDPQKGGRRIPAARPPGRPVDDDAHEIEADEDQKACQDQKAQSDEMAKRRCFPRQAQRVALYNNSQGQLQQSIRLNDVSALRGKVDPVFRTMRESPLAAPRFASMSPPLLLCPAAFHGGSVSLS